MIFYKILTSATSPFKHISCKDADLVFVPVLSNVLFRLDNRMHKVVDLFNKRARIELPFLETKPHLAILGRIQKGFIIFTTHFSPSSKSLAEERSLEKTTKICGLVHLNVNMESTRQIIF